MKKPSKLRVVKAILLTQGTNAALCLTRRKISASRNTDPCLSIFSFPLLSFTPLYFPLLSFPVVNTSQHATWKRHRYSVSPLILLLTGNISLTSYGCCCNLYALLHIRISLSIPSLFVDVIPTATEKTLRMHKVALMKRKMKLVLDRKVNNDSSSRNMWVPFSVEHLSHQID
uniref:Uncharacterized protein n=1 Tax=Glossina brevipalpis TaxID=37001 RepID=A0A1A9WEC9_9MUSC